MKIAVIIPAHNAGRRIGIALGGLLSQSRPPDLVVTVDDGSTDDTGRHIHRWLRLMGLEWSCHVETVRLDRREGRAGALNQGMRHIDDLKSRYGVMDVVVTVDADTVLHPAYLAEVGNAFDNDPRVGIAGGRVTSLVTKTIWQWGRWAEYAWSFGVLRPLAQLFGFQWVCSGCCQAVRVAALEGTRLGPRIRGMVQGWSLGHLGEDMELTWRLQSQGWKARYLSNAVASTVDPENLRGLYRQAQRWAHAFFQTVKTPMPGRGRLPITLAVAMAASTILTGLAPFWGVLLGWNPWRWVWLLLVPFGVAYGAWQLWDRRLVYGTPQKLDHAGSLIRSLAVGIVCLVPVLVLNTALYSAAFVWELVLRQKREAW